MAICAFKRAAPLRRALSSLAGPRPPDDVDWGRAIVNNNLTDYSPRYRLRCRSLFIKESVKLADAAFGDMPMFLVHCRP